VVDHLPSKSTALNSVPSMGDGGQGERKLIPMLFGYQSARWNTLLKMQTLTLSDGITLFLEWDPQICS
jgi:hypothetical protein